ncbi:universal stress protein [Myroides pelagicus]|uniref:Universal stress protein n=1 Tax=Myroides pelagicus TaxID=270914 RepID=A0A7K1GJF9_9FLAO|nr:universal stress protein [Myroides pelagicus]MEC4113674.1 universal stress protein [Myroides pelagicus]MTH28870.1 universal stress protein [Myroides pelagicus]
MKKILFPTDYSETANNAFKYALQLANQKNANLYVLHVYDPPVISGHISPKLVDGVSKRSAFQNLEELQTHTPELNQIRTELNLEHVEVFYKVEEGLLIPEIINAIEELHIDFIVMGTEGTNANFAKRILGSNTLNTISKVKVPVLSVPKEAQYRPVKNIVFTTMLNLEEQETLDRIIEGAINFDYHVKCVHIKRNDCEDCDKVYEEWKERYKDKPITFHIINAENIEQTIMDFIDSKKPIDIVATIQRNKSFFESILQKSTTQHLAKHLKIPFLVYKAHKA